MRKVLIIIAAAALLAPVAAMATAPQSSNASRTCTALKATMGATAFAQAYPTFGACVSAVTPLDKSNTTSAQSLCTAEQNDANFAASHNGKTFAQFYGTNGSQASDKGKAGDNGNANGNAFGKCVSAKANAKTAAQQSATVKAAKACKTDATLKAKIADHTYKNFGACVKAQAKLA